MSSYTGTSIRSALSDLGIEIIREDEDELYAQCPMHLRRTGKIDHNPSWSINAETGAHHCFSCGYSGGLASLVADLQGIKTPDEISTWIADHRTYSVSHIKKKLLKLSEPVAVNGPAVLPESNLALFEAPPEWALAARHLRAASCEYYGVLWDQRHDAWITSVRDPVTGDLWGWQLKSQTKRMFRNYPLGVKKSQTFFGWEKYNGGDLILVESPLDAVRLHSEGISHGVSSFGAVLSDEQLRMLRLGDRVIIAMDNDEAGIKSALDVLDASRRFSFECYFFNYSHTKAKDVGDMTTEEIYEGIESARHCVYGKRAIA